MPPKRILDTATLLTSKKAKIEELTCFQKIGQDITKQITMYLSHKDLYHFKLTSKETNINSIEMPKHTQITMENFEEACNTVGVHTIKLDKENEGLQQKLNNCGITKDLEYLLVTDLLIDFCGNKENRHISRCTIGLLFPKLKSLKYIRCAHDVELLIPYRDEPLALLEIYTSGVIKLYCDRTIGGAHLCSTDKSILEAPTIAILPWNIFNIDHIQKIKYHGEKVAIGRITSGPHSDFVPNPKFQSQ